MHIVSLEASNFMRLSAVHITPEGNVVVLGGDNGAGKTSVLESIVAALGGARNTCETPVRQGRKRADIVLDLGDLRVTRSFTTKGGGALTVTGADGEKVASPQTILNRLTGRLTFDPLAFATMPPKDQLETLKGLVGLDFAAQDAKRDELYAERTIVNRGVKQQEARIAAMPLHADAPKKPVSVSDLVGELERCRKVNTTNANVRNALEVAKAGQDDAETAVADIEAQLHAAKQRLAEVVGRVEQLTAEAATLEDADEAAIAAQIEAAEGTNKKVAANAARKIAIGEKNKADAESRKLTAAIDEIDASKETALAKAEFPIDGLAFDEDGVTLNGLPFGQASAAEKLRVSVAMGIALNPELKVLLIRDGSLLDAKNLKAVAQMAEAAGAQVWIERVGDGDECTVVIEDGHVRGTNDTEVSSDADTEVGTEA